MSYPDEDRILSEIESQLEVDDPALAAYLRGQVRRRHIRRARALIFLVAPAMILPAIALHLTPLLLVGLVLVPVTPGMAWALGSPLPVSLWRRLLAGLRGRD